MKKILIALVLFMGMFQNVWAQDQSVEMADAFRADGKIYIVLAVVLIILIGLLAYLFAIDRRLKRLEKQS